MVTLTSAKLSVTSFWIADKTMELFRGPRPRPLSFTTGLGDRQRESGPTAFARPQLQERVLQIPYSGFESFVEVERVLRCAIVSQAQNVGLHLRLFNEEPCEFGSA